MDDHNGKKAACWKKTGTISPTFVEVLAKLEELRIVLEEEQQVLRSRIEDSPTTETDESHEVGVGTVTDG